MICHFDMVSEIERLRFFLTLRSSYLDWQLFTLGAQFQTCLNIAVDNDGTFGNLDGWLRYTARSEALVEAQDPITVAALEAEFGFDQRTAVAHLVESTDWGAETFPQFQGGKGELAERLQALRARWADWKRA